MGKQLVNKGVEKFSFHTTRHMYDKVSIAYCDKLAAGVLENANIQFYKKFDYEFHKELDFRIILLIVTSARMFDKKDDRKDPFIFDPIGGDSCTDQQTLLLLTIVEVYNKNWKENGVIGNLLLQYIGLSLIQ